MKNINVKSIKDELIGEILMLKLEHHISSEKSISIKTHL